MDSKSPTLSVIVPNYNHAKLLPRCLDGILTQSFQPMEVIVIDDGSTDNSREVIENYAKRYPVIKTFPNDKNRGVSYTLNRGLALAKGDYVAFPGADDEVMPGIFEKQMALFSKYPQAAMCATIVEFRNMETQQTYHQGTKVSDVPRYFSPEEVVKLAREDRLILFTSTMTMRREAILEAGYLPELRWHSDWYAYFVPSFRHGFCFIPEVLGEFAVYPSSYSKKGMRDPKAQYEVLHHLLENLLSDKNRDILPAIKRSGVLAPFGKEMFRVLLSNKRYRQFITPAYMKNAAWWIARIEAKKVLPTWVADLYFRLAGHKVPENKSLEAVRNKVAKPTGQ